MWNFETKLCQTTQEQFGVNYLKWGAALLLPLSYFPIIYQFYETVEEFQLGCWKVKSRHNRIEIFEIMDAKFNFIEDCKNTKSEILLKQYALICI